MSTRFNRRLIRRITEVSNNTISPIGRFEDTKYDDDIQLKDLFEKELIANFDDQRNEILRV